jgi:hypothetical protein
MQTNGYLIRKAMFMREIGVPKFVWWLLLLGLFTLFVKHIRTDWWVCLSMLIAGWILFKRDIRLAREK